MASLHRLDDGPEACALWWVDLDIAPSAEQIGWLDVGERQRAERFHFKHDRRRYLAAHVALRQVLGQVLSCAPQSIDITSDRRGKPQLAGGANCNFNLSHSGAVAVIGISRFAAIGVDVEVLRPIVDASALSLAYFTAGEQAALAGLSGAELNLAFLRTWTRKEACLKALGVGLSLSPATFHVGTDSGTAQATLDTDSGPASVQVCSLPCTGAFVAAVARVEM